MTTAREVIEETLRHWNDAIRPDILGDMELHDSILSALDKSGYQVCPKEPTHEMLRACLAALGIDADRKAEDILDHLDVNKAASAVSAYRAMLSAHAKEEAKE